MKMTAQHVGRWRRVPDPRHSWLIVVVVSCLASHVRAEDVECVYERRVEDYMDDPNDTGGASDPCWPRHHRALGMPTTASVLTITCTLIGFALEAHNDTAAVTGPDDDDTLNTLCITDNGTQYPLAGDQATRRWLDQFEWGLKLATTLTPQNEEGGVAYSIINASLAPGHTPPAGTHSVASLQSVASLEGSGRYFSGERRIRLLSVLVEVNGFVPEYAGSTRAEREAWAIDQRRFMDESWRFGTFGKLGFDEEASRVVTVDLGTVNLLHGQCFWRMFEISKAAGAQVAPTMTP